jgi:hypothetical protein
MHFSVGVGSLPPAQDAGATAEANMRMLVTVVLVAGALGINLAQCYAASCQELWVARNSIYKHAGYCFSTARAIAYFGNAGCRYDNQNDVPLSQAARRRIDNIVAQERYQGCSD